MKRLWKKCRDYRRYRKLRHYVRRKYYERLVRATLLLSIIPMCWMCVLVIYNRLTVEESFIGVIIIFFSATFFAKPYLYDLSALTNYVEQLALDRKSIAPPLSFLSSVEELSAAVSRLNRSWEKKTLSLEAAIAESKILFDTLQEKLLMIDEDYKIVRANNAALLVLGHHIISKHIMDAVPAPQLRESLHDVTHNKKERVQIEFDVTIHNIEYAFFTDVIKFPIHSPGGIAYVIVLHDMTEIKKTKQTIKDFVANASHEIRTPLTSLTGFVELLQTDAGDDPETRRKFLSIIEEQVVHMNTLINNLLSLSRVEIREASQPSALVDIKDVIESSVHQTEWFAKERNMRVVYEASAKTPPILGDASELVQVCVNLISNAIKYGDEGTPIEIRTTVETHHAEHGANRATLCVHIKNYGEGIEEEHIARLTERFYRIDKSRSRKIGGTGLGLSIVKHILNRHHGTLNVQSDVGTDVTFSICFPVPSQRDIALAQHSAAHQGTNA